MRLRLVLTFAALAVSLAAGSSVSTSGAAASTSDIRAATPAPTATSAGATATAFSATKRAGKPDRAGNSGSNLGHRPQSTRARPAPPTGAPTGIRGRYHERRTSTGAWIRPPGLERRARAPEPRGVPAGRIAVVCVVAVAALSVTGTASAYTIEPGFERAAAVLGARATILCQSSRDHARLAENLDGRSYTTTAGAWRIELAPAVCGALGGPGAEAAEAAAVLAHELGHVVRGSCELAAETFAMQNWARLYRLLGLGEPTADGRALVRADHNALPARYRVGSCPRSSR